MRRLLVSIAALLLAACGSSQNDSASAVTTNVHGAGNSADASVGFDGYGALRFGMNRAAAEQAIGDHFAGPEELGACEELLRADEPDITYLFLNGSLQRIDVQSRGAMAVGGGRVGMEMDDIHSLYAGNLSEGGNNAIPGGHSFKVTGPKGNGLVFQTDGNGAVTAFYTSTAAAVNRAGGCPP